MRFILPPQRQKGIYRYSDFTRNKEFLTNAPVNLDFVEYIELRYQPSRNSTNKPENEENEYWFIIFRMLDNTNLYWYFYTEKERNLIYNLLLIDYIRELPEIEN